MGNETVVLNTAGDLLPLDAIGDWDLDNLVSESLNKAESMIQMTYGVNGEAFRGMSDEIQDNTLWAIAGLLRLAVKAESALSMRRIRARQLQNG